MEKFRLTAIVLVFVLALAAGLFASNAEIKEKGEVPEVTSANESKNSLAFALKAFAAAFAIGICAASTAYAQARIGTAGIGTMAEKPELSGRVMLLVAIPETLVILGFVIAALILL